MDLKEKVAFGRSGMGMSWQSHEKDQHVKLTVNEFYQT